MFSLVDKRYFGLDIGESAVKFVEIRKTREGYRLGKARLVELNIDPTFDTSEKRSGIVKESLKRLLSEEGINSGTVALSISGQSVFIRPLKVPKIAKNKIEQIIHYEAQLQIPFPINEVIWNYELFDIYDSPETEVALVAVKKDIIDEKLKLLSETGLEVDFIEVDPFSLYNVLDFVNGIKNKIILDIGAKITNIIIVEERKIWTRSILIGGNDLTKAIASNLEISFKEAEALKRKEGIIAMTDEDRTSAPRAAAISDAISPILVELLTDISKSIGYYKSQFGGTKIFREILLTGGCSKLRNITRFIRENIDMPTKIFDLFEKIKGDLDFKLTEDLIGRMDVSIGLALRTVTPLTTKVNLLPKELLRSKEFEKRKWYIFGSLLVAILVFMTLAGFLNWSIKKKNTTLARVSTMAEDYTALHDKIRDLQSEIEDFKVRLEFISGALENRKRTITLFAELTKLLPDNLWLTEIKQDKGALTLTGRVRGSFESINTFRDMLAESDYFKDVQIESADVLKDKDTTEDIRAFSIRIEMYPADNKPSGEEHGT